MIENLQTFPPLVLMAVVCFCVLCGFFWSYVICNQFWCGLAQAWHEGGWQGVRNFLATGILPFPPK